MAKNTTAKKHTVKRVGANRRKLMEEQRAQRPLAIMRSAKRVSIAVAVAVLAAAAGFAVFAHGPVVLAKVTESAQSARRLSANARITNCGARTHILVKNVIDSLMGNDSLSFDRAEALKAIAAISEIEKVSIRSVKDRASRERITSVKVTERKPVAFVHCGSIALVDKKGVRFAANSGQFYDLPLLIAGSRQVSRDTVDLAVFNAIRKASRNLGGAFFEQISQIDLSDSAAVNLFFKSGEAEYTIGCNDIEAKLPLVKKLRERLLEERGELMRVDLRYRSLAFASVQ